MSKHQEIINKLSQVMAITMLEAPSRELSTVKTKIDEAIMWAEKDRSMKAAVAEVLS